MKKLLLIILLSVSIRSLQCMDTTKQVVNPLGPVIRSNAADMDESASLLAHDFLDNNVLKSATTSSEEPQAELTRLTNLLSQKERELRLLQKNFPRLLDKLDRERCLAHITSNEITGGIATGFYGANLIMQTGIINKPEIWSSLKFPVINSFVSTWCSLAYFMILEECKKCVN